MQVKYSLPHKMTAEIEIKDAITGKVEQIIPAQSFIQHLVNILYVQGSTLSLGSQSDTGGTLRTILAATNSMSFNANGVIADSAMGIVVGTGTNAVTVTDTKLQTQIAHGVGAGQLQYGASSFLSPVTSGSDRYFEVTRTFTNSSGSDITVNEIGIYINNGTSNFKFCVERTLNTFTVLNGGAKTITYRIKVTV